MSEAQETYSRRFIPKSAAYHRVSEKRPVREFNFLLLPRFTLNALSSAMEPLRIANQLSQRELYRWFTVAEEARVECSGFTEIGISRRLCDVPVKSEVFVVSGTNPAKAASEKTVSWLRRHSRTGGNIGALCTGAFTLARAGILGDRRFTLHWENQASFHELFPDRLSTNRIFEIDRGLMTCGGGRAAADMMLHVIREDYGVDFANTVADMCLHGAPRMCSVAQRSSTAFSTRSRNTYLVNAIELMRNNLEEPLSMDLLAELSGCSRRQLERLFRQSLKTTPGKYYRDLRLDHGYSLLVETNMSATDVAMAAGFRNSVHFSKCFKQRFGAPPTLTGSNKNQHQNRELHQ